jgi:hypothetical protein
LLGRDDALEAHAGARTIDRHSAAVQQAVATVHLFSGVDRREQQARVPDQVASRVLQAAVRGAREAARGRRSGRGGSGHDLVETLRSGRPWRCRRLRRSRGAGRRRRHAGRQ